MKHSPLPWKIIEICDNNLYASIISKKKEIAKITALPCIGYNSLESVAKEERANAEFIIRACNSYYDLLGALKELCNNIEAVYGPECAGQAQEKALKVIADLEK